MRTVPTVMAGLARSRWRWRGVRVPDPDTPDCECCQDGGDAADGRGVDCRVRWPHLTKNSQTRAIQAVASRPPRALVPAVNCFPRTSPMNGAESLVHTLLRSGVDTCFCNPGTSEMHFVAALDRVPGMRCVLGPVRGRGDRCGRWLRAHVRQAGGDAAALRAGPGQRACQPAQRAPCADADRQYRRRPGDLSPPERCTADRRHRGLGARRLGLGAHRDVVGHGRCAMPPSRCRPREPIPARSPP